MRIAVSSSTFRLPLDAGELTQLEWLERCASELGVDGVIAALSDFPRLDGEYVAQLRKVAIDLGIVPFGIDAPGLLDQPDAPDAAGTALGAATGFGAAVVRTTLPPPGEVPPATFAEAVRTAKRLAGAAKGANVTVVVATAPGTIGADVAGVRHLLKDVDSAWLRACPPALTDPAEMGPKDRFPAFVAASADDPAAVAERAHGAWVILDVPAAPGSWGPARDAIAALRKAEAERRLTAAR